jgi:hypothetical protein
MEGRSYTEADIALLLRAKRRLELFIQAIEGQDARSVAKHLAKVLPGDDGTLRDMYMSDPSLLSVLKSHLRPPDYGRERPSARAQEADLRRPSGAGDQAMPLAVPSADSAPRPATESDLDGGAA